MQILLFIYYRSLSGLDQSSKIRQLFTLFAAALLGDRSNRERLRTNLNWL